MIQLHVASLQSGEQPLDITNVVGWYGVLHQHIIYINFDVSPDLGHKDFVD